jgi:hypothetical protein
MPASSLRSQLAPTFEDAFRDVAPVLRVHEEFLDIGFDRRPDDRGRGVVERLSGKERDPGLNEQEGIIRRIEPHPVHFEAEPSVVPDPPQRVVEAERLFVRVTVGDDDAQLGRVAIRSSAWRPLRCPPAADRPREQRRKREAGRSRTL